MPKISLLLAGVEATEEYPGHFAGALRIRLFLIYGGEARKVGVSLQDYKNHCVFAVQQSTPRGTIRYYNVPKIADGGGRVENQGI